MEGRAVLSLLALALMFAGHASAGFSHCFDGCYPDCGGDVILPCWECLKHCLFQGNSLVVVDRHFYCTLGCSMDQCAQFITDPEKMESCVDKCSGNVCSISLHI